jgi:hypothetical protein
VLYGPPHPPHKYAGPEKVASPGEKIYTGGCHCGNVTIALKTKPLSEVETRQCDCSICTRVRIRFLSSACAIAYANLLDHRTDMFLRTPTRTMLAYTSPTPRISRSISMVANGSNTSSVMYAPYRYSFVCSARLRRS